jgi:hypothetical protein
VTLDQHLDFAVAVDVLYVKIAGGVHPQPVFLILQRPELVPSLSIKDEGLEARAIGWPQIEPCPFRLSVAIGILPAEAQRIDTLSLQSNLPRRYPICDGLWIKRRGWCRCR